MIPTLHLVFGWAHQGERGPALPIAIWLDLKQSSGGSDRRYYSSFTPHPSLNRQINYHSPKQCHKPIRSLDSNLLDLSYWVCVSQICLAIRITWISRGPRVWFPASSWWLTILCNPNSRDLNDLLEHPGALYSHGALTCRQNAYNIQINAFLKIKKGAEGMALCLRVLVTLLKGPHSLPSPWCLPAPVLGDPIPSSGLCRYCTHWCTDTCRQNTHIKKKEVKHLKTTW